ncbi:MAG: lysylphosphatidylglycerol synthase transmembrane domain-containing protein, partial [Patescibacteria group bacterium]
MKKAIAIGLSLLITGVVSWFLLKSVPASAFVDAFSHVSVYAIVVGFVMAVLMAVIDGVRYWELLRRKTSIDHMTSVACLHNMLINVMPARTGDLSFPYFAHRFGVPLGAGVGSLVVARVFDVFALATLLFTGAWLVPGTTLFAEAKVPMLITTGVLLLILILVVVFRHAAHTVVHKIANVTKVSQHKVGQWLLQKFEEVLHGLDVLKSPTSLFIVYVCSVANWLAQCVITLVLTQALGLPLSFA